MFVEYRVTKGVRGLLTIGRATKDAGRRETIKQFSASWSYSDKNKKTVRVTAYAQRSMVPEKGRLPSVREQLVHIHLVENNDMQVLSLYPSMAT